MLVRLVLMWIMLVPLLASGCSEDSSGTTDSSSDLNGVRDIMEETGADAEVPGDVHGLEGVPDVPDVFIANVNQNGSFTFRHESHTLPVQEGEQTVSLALSLTIPEGDGPFPLVVFTHGFMMSPEHYVSYGERLASWGIAVVMPKMPGNLTNPKTHRQQADYLSAILDWAVDGEEGPLAGKVDGDRIGLGGHSMGGKLSFLLASEDPRPKAVFGVDPVDAGPPVDFEPLDYPTVVPDRMGQISVPFVALGETLNGNDGAMSCAPAAGNFQQFFAHAQSPALEIDVLGANHMSFVDDPECGIACAVCPKGTDDPVVTRELTLKYMTAFFRAELQEGIELYTYLTGKEMQKDVDAGLVSVDSKNGFGDSQ
jgi:pimeloyl-ACP methyl ester carboxylesterase